MKTKKAGTLVMVVLLFGLTIRLFCGVFQHDEFGYDVYFIKHRPTWQWRFYSPRGMSDLPLHQMTPQQANEQRAFDEFVGNRVTR